jgi:hypothetical protein
MLLAWVAALATSFAPADVEAHGRSLSYSNWHFIDDGARVSVRIPLLELTRLQIPLPLDQAGRSRTEPDAVGPYLASRLNLRTAGGRCEPTTGPSPRPTDEGWVLYRWTVRCPDDGARTIRSDVLLEVAPSHLHFARVTLPPTDDSDRPRIVERVLSDSQPAWSLPARGADSVEETSAEYTGSSLADYVTLGVQHILSGWDHLAFVLALVLLAGGLGDVARLITGFTLAHSLTLALAVLGLVHPQAAPVEAVIGFSVALIAAENAWILGGRGLGVPVVAVAGLALMTVLALAGHGELSALALIGLTVFSACHFGLLEIASNPSLHRIALAFAFGLVHGFGFAGVLADMTLPTERLAPALFGFNIGVEIGQLAVVAMIWPILEIIRRVAEGKLYRPVAELASACVCGTGVFWFLTRAFATG